MGNRYSENKAQLKYVGTTVTNENLFARKNMMRTNMGNTWHRSVQNLCSGNADTRKEHRLRVSEDRVEENIWTE
jgi:hypothetical protein